MSWIRDLDNGRFQAIYRDGKKRQRSRTFDRKKDAKTWLAAQTVDLAAGKWTDPRAGEVLLRDFVKRWQAGRDVEPTTQASDKGRIDNHLIPSFGDWPVAAIKYLDVQEWMQVLKRKGLSPKTRRECLALLKMILDAAVTEGKIPANPASTVKAPAKVKPVHQKLTRTTIDLLLASKAGTGLKARVAVAAFCGLRWGEVCGLRWGNVNIAKKTIDVVETMGELGGYFYRKPYPKDRESRTVPMADELVTLLIEHKADLLRKGTQAVADDALVFPSRAGGPIYRSNNDRALSRACGLAAVKPLNFKDLRRWCASYLINDRRVPVTMVKELLGHSKASMTLEVYTEAPTGWHDTVREAFAPVEPK